MNTLTRPGRRVVPLLIATLAALPLLSPTLWASGSDDGTQLEQHLTNTGLIAGKAEVELEQFPGGAEKLEVKLRDVPTGDYALYVGANQTLRGVINVVSQGGGQTEGELEFHSAGDDDLLLDFPVLDELFQIRQQGQVFFSDVFSPGAGSSDDLTGLSDKIEVPMVAVGSDFNAKGKLKFKAKQGELEFEIEVEHLDPGSFRVRVGGEAVADFSVPASAGATASDDDEVEIKFSSPFEDSGPLAFELTFDPLARQVDVTRVDALDQTEALMLTAFLPASKGQTGNKSPKGGKSIAKDTGHKDEDGLKIALFGTGVLSKGEAVAELRQSAQETRLKLELEHVPGGSYDLRVDGVLRAEITVADGALETELHFSDALEGPELLLDFAVKGKLIEVVLGGDVVFSNVFPISVQSALGSFKKERHTQKLVKLNLLNSGLDLDARGLLIDRQTATRELLKIKLKGLPADTYALFIDGVQRATLVVKKHEANTRLTFDSKLTAPKGHKLPLDFEVRDTLATIRSEDGLLTWLQVTVE